MPILAREPDLFPEDLLDRPETGNESTHHWWVIHTKPRQEKTLARQLSSLTVSHYVPQYEKRFRTNSGRKRTTFVPLFAGYGFVYASQDDRVRMFSSTAVARVLEVPDSRQLTFDLRQIRRLTETGRPLQPESRIQPGTSVRITTGPFEGFEGHIMQQRAGHRLLVVVNYLQQGVSVEIEDDEMELL